MARGHWLDPLARSLLEATGQLPRQPKPSSAITGPAGCEPDEPELSSAVERDLLELKLRHDPGRRLIDPAEVQHAAALGWRLDVNRASAADWLRLPGITPSQVDLLLRLQQGGVQLSGPDDLQRLLELPRQQIEAWEPLLLFRWYGDGAPPPPSRRQVDLNHANPTTLEQQLPQLDASRRARLLRERQRAPFSDLADLQLRLQLPPALVEDLIGKVRFGQGPAGPQLPRSA
jgi:DNA uptake protein ComE-like DNA-binding protein